MKISVIYKNDTLGMVSVHELNELLEKNAISGFRRSSGWTVVGKDELRNSRINDSGSWKDRKISQLLLKMYADSYVQNDGTVHYQWEGLTRK